MVSPSQPRHRACCVSVMSVLLTSAWLLSDGHVRAQQPAAPAPPAATVSKTQPAAEPRREQPNFVGSSYNLDSGGLVVVRRRFEPGARTSWHAHGADFLLVVEEGRARVQLLGQPMRELKKGDTDFTPAGTMHWHGAAPTEAFVQFGAAYGGGIKYGEAVTDAQYNGQ
ncbi:MAG TPA: cupin domain-containing protein [Vicinamibacterales bacterium]